MAGRKLGGLVLTGVLLVSGMACGGTQATAVDTKGHESSAAHRLGWTVRDGDEFAGNELDLDRWKIYDGPGNGGVGVRSPGAVEVRDGQLAVTAAGDVSGGIAWRGSAATTYGRWEFRARGDRGTGYSPVVLLWPDSDRWPQDGEIDIMEIPVGDRSAMSISVHWGEDHQQMTKWIPGDFSEWHVFAVEWTHDSIAVFVDGEQVFMTREQAAIPHGPMHLAVQNDIGPFEDWIPAPDDSTPDKVGLYVDWVRMYY
jgi:beta-glucanase (GH16 family)